MRFPLLKLAISLTLAASALPASAQILNDYNPGDPDNSFLADQLLFITGVNDQQPQNAGFNYRTVPGLGSTPVYDFCADFFSGTNYQGLEYDVSAGLGSISSPESDAIRALFSNALFGFNTLLDNYIAANGENGWDYNPALDAEYNALQGYAAGMQIALWEIRHDGTDNGMSILNGSGSTPGNFRVDPVDPANPRGALGRAYAEIFLTNIRNGVWTDTGLATFYFAAPVDPDEQDRIWVSVPEPSAALLGALGFLMILRRRR